MIAWGSDWRKVASAWWPAVLCMVVIFILSDQPKLPRPPILGSADKLQHSIAYMALALAVLRGALLVPLVRLNPYLQAFLIAALFGASDEYHQSFVRGRQSDIMDWLADVAGILLALGLVYLYRHRRNGGR